MCGSGGWWWWGVFFFFFFRSPTLFPPTLSQKSIRLFDLATSRARHTLTGHTGKVTSVSSSPADAARCASAGADRAIRVWDLARGYALRASLTPSTPHCVAYGVDGRTLVSGHFDGSVRLWDADTGRETAAAPKLHDGGVTSVCVSLTGAAVLTCGRDGALRVLDARALGAPLATLRAPSFTVAGPHCGACLGPDARHAAAGSADGTLHVWSVESGELVRRLGRPGGPPLLTTAWSPRGAPVVSGDKAGGVSLWAGKEVEDEEDG